MAQLNPYLRFNGNCKEAMTFYKNCLGGELDFQTVGESPMASEMPAGSKDRIMHSTLKTGKITIIASDMMRDKAVFGDNISLFLECESENEINALFSKLSKDGEVFMPLGEQFWGGIFGVVTDKFGIEWALNFQKKAN